MSEFPAPDYEHNPYALPDHIRDELTAKLLLEHPPAGESPVVCYCLNGADTFSDIGRSIECEVFEKAFGNSNNADEMLKEYGKYEENSTFFLAVDRESRKAIGALRVITDSSNEPENFKTLDDLDKDSRDVFAQTYGLRNFSQLWDIGTVAVPEAHRAKTGPVSGLLYYAMYKSAMDQGIKHFVSVIDSKVYEKMRNFLGIPFEPLLNKPPQGYLGTLSQFAYGRADEFMGSVKKKRRKYIFVKSVREATAPLVGKADDALQF